jgi:hypothetical protein
MPVEFLTDEEAAARAFLARRNQRRMPEGCVVGGVLAWCLSLTILERG